MAQPSHQSVHINRVLTNISVAYTQEQQGYIAPRVFPVIPVDKQSDMYFTYNRNDWLRDEARVRAPGTESSGSGYRVGNESYYAPVYAHHKDVDDQTLANADQPLNLEREAAQFVTQQLMLRRERQWAADFFKTGVWATDMTGVASGETGTQFRQWDDYDDADPIADLEAAATLMASTTGRWPNKLVIGVEAYNKLVRHPDILDRFKYTNGGRVTREMLTALLLPEGVDGVEIIVGRSIVATNEEGEAESYAFIHGKAALLAYVAPNPGLLTPSAGYTFSWKGVSNGMGETIAISDIRVPLTKTTRYEGEMAFANKIVAPDLGVFFNTVVS